MTRSVSCIVILALSVSAFPLAAQVPQVPTGFQAADPNDPVETLGRYLRVLSASPRDLEALTGAGRAALDVGDANAAIGFYARAEEIAPRDGRIKAGLATALVQMEQPKQALKLFGQAVDLGVPVANIAADRGLAYDLSGDTRRAQADYAIALRTDPKDETIRRLALSQAMSGDRTTALTTLDPLLRRQDKAAWRASTFVLALTGDEKGATQRLGLLVSPQQAVALTPFLKELAGLKPAQQAEAVHFGHLPADKRVPATVATASADLSGSAMPAPLRPALTRRSDRVASATVADPAVEVARRSAEASVARLPDRGLRPAAVLPRVTMAAPAADGVKGAAVISAPTQMASASIGGATPAALSPVRSLTPNPSRSPSTAAIASNETGLGSGTPLVSAQIDPRFVESMPAQVARADLPPSRATNSSGDGADMARVTTRVVPLPSMPLRLARPSMRAATPSDALQKQTSDKATVPAVRSPLVRRRTELAFVDPPSVKSGKRADVVDDDSGTSAVRKTKSVADEKSSGRGDRSGGKDAETKSTRRTQAAETASVRTGRDASGKTGSKSDPAKKTADAAREDKADKAKKAAEAAKLDKAKLAASAKKEPPRYWVQVATGANKADLPKAWARVKAQYPSLMGGKSPWTTPLRFTNRLLVGPFKSDDEAQAFVNTSGKAGFGTSPFTSSSGQAVERLGSK